MPAKQLFNKFADIASLEKEKAKVIAIFKEIKSGLGEMQKFGDKINLSGSVKQTTKATKEYQGVFLQLNKLQKEYAAQQKEIVKLQKQLADSQQKENEGKKRSTKLTTEEKLAKADALKIEKERLKLRAAEDGSYNKLNLQLQKATRIYNNLSEAQAKTARGQGLNKFIADTNAKLKELDATQGRFNRKVGDYAGSLSSGFELVSKKLDELKTKQQGLQNLSQRNPIGFQTGGGDAELKAVNAQLDILERTVVRGFSSNKTYEQSVRGIGRSYGDMVSSGQFSKEFLEEFKKFAADARDGANDLREELVALSSDTRKLDLVTGSLNTFASGFQVVAGSAQLLGGESENTQKAILKLVAVQQVANGVRELGTQVTKKGTLANKAYNFVVEQGTVLFGKGSTAAERFGAALKSVIILAVIGFVAQLISKLSGSAKAAEQARLSVEQLTTSLENYKAIVDSLNKDEDYNFQQEIERIRLQNAEKLKGAKSETERERIEAENKKKLFDAEITFKEKRLEDFKTRQKQATKDFEEEEKKLATLRALSRATSGGLTGIAGGGVSKEEVEASKERLEILRKEKEEARVIVSESQREINLIKSRGNVEQAENELAAIKEREKLSKENSENEKKAILELFKFRQEIIRDQNALISDNTDLSSNFRIKAAIKAAEAEQAIVVKQNQFDLQQERLTSSQIILINEKAAKEIFDIENKLAIKILNIRLGGLSELKNASDEVSLVLKQAEEDRFAETQDLRSNNFSKEKNEIKKFYLDDIALAKQNFDNGLTTKEQYYSRLLTVQENFHSASLQADVNFYTEQVAILREAGYDTTQAEEALNAAREALLQRNIDNQKNAIDQQREINEQLKQAQIQSYIEIGQAVKDAFENVVASAYDRQLERIQEQIDAIEKLRKAEIDRINASGESAAKKEALISAAEQKAQSRREALEQRQRQLERQKAIFERAAKAFSITSGGIIDVSKIRTAAAATFANAMATIPAPANVGVATGLRALVLSQVPGVIAGTAAALVSLLAQPLPRFYTGVDSAPGGPAYTAEKGREMYIEPSGKIGMYEGEAIRNVKKGTRIFSNDVTERIIESNEIGKNFYLSYSQQPKESNNYDEQLVQLKEINKKTGVNLYIHNHNGIESSAWYDKNMKH